MNEKVLHTLEYDKIINQLTEKADSAPGKKLCQELVPSTDLEEIQAAQAQTRDGLSRLFKKGTTSFGGNQDIGYSLRSLEIGSALSVQELMKLSRLLNNVNRFRQPG